MIELRDYQKDAVAAVLKYLETKDGNPLIAAPTGSGKAIIQAAIVKEILSRWPNERFLLLAHSKELLAQNASKVAAMCPGVGVGIYSAGIGRKELGQQVTIAGIQSAHRIAHKVGDISVVIVDECFAAGTKILMADGSAKSIEDVSPGDSIAQFNGSEIVSQAVEATKEAHGKQVVDLVLSGRYVVKCTKNHPFLTTGGWKEAGEIKNGDRIVSCVLERVSGEIQELGEVLQQGVRSHKQIKEGVRREKSNACREPKHSERSKRENEGKKPNGGAGDARESVGNTQRDGLAPAISRRERARADGATKDSAWLAWMGGGIPNQHRRSEIDRVSALLQGGHSEPIKKDSGRGGRRVALCAGQEGARQKERRFSVVNRVARVASKEQRRAGGPRESGPVYNLQVGGNNTYILADSGAVVHNCHLVSKAGDTMYRQLFADLLKYCPHAKIVGMTATPWRLDSGPLIKGKDRIFTDIAYQISIKELIEQGYLSPLTTKPTATRIKTDGVGKRGGEFIAGELERAANQDPLTQAALDEVEAACADRKSWLVFCAGVNHTHAVCRALLARGHKSAVITGDTGNSERDSKIAQFKRGELRALVSVGVLTTGFDAPNADALVCLRPTMSPGLWVQIVGRVSRLSPGKQDGLVLDFTNNTRTHGPVDLIEVDGDGNLVTSPAVICAGCFKEFPRKLGVCPHCGLSRVKPCKRCNAPMELGTYECADCGFVQLPPERTIKHETKASSASILSGAGGVVTEKVRKWEIVRHKKDGRPDSLAVSYYVDMLTEYREWVCPEHAGYAGEKAAHWWRKRGGKTPAPMRVNDALARISELKMPEQIRVKRDGKYWRVL